MGGKLSYTILLILTDGAVSDINSTAAGIARASNAPLSIVIVGIGNADFNGMQFLDDFNSAQFGGPGRDIVQFVQFNKHAHNSVALTSETLNEIPTQLSQYFKSRGIQPGQPIQPRENLIVADSAEDEIDLSLQVSNDNEIRVASGGDDFVSGFRAAN